MKKFNLIALMAVIALITTGAYAREASFEEVLGGDTGSIIRSLDAAQLADGQKISFPVPAGMESCKYSSVQGNTCSFTCKSGATVTRPRLDSSVAQNGGCALFVMVPVQNKAAAPRITRVSCTGRSNSDGSTSAFSYLAGSDTAQVSVSRTVCSYWGPMPVGCVPQNITRDLRVIKKSLGARAVSLVLDNNGTDLDINIAQDGAPGVFSGTWFAHENNYTYHLTCDVK